MKDYPLPEDIKFTMCDTCLRKPDGEMLCPGCTLNRMAIHNLQRILEMRYQAVRAYPLRLREAMPGGKFPVAIYYADIPDSAVWEIYGMGMSDAAKIIKPRHEHRSLKEE